MRPIFFVAFSFFSIVAALLIYSGIFADITIENDSNSERWIIYETHIGPYSRASTVLEYVETSLYAEDDALTNQTFGLYFDNPKHTETKDLRSVLGVILDYASPELINYLSTRYKIAKLPAFKSTSITVPYKNLISKIIAKARVYPILYKYLEENLREGLPILEVYDSTSEKVTFSSPLNLSPDFLEAIFENKFSVNTYLHE